MLRKCFTKRSFSFEACLFDRCIITICLILACEHCFPLCFLSLNYLLMLLKKGFELTRTFMKSQVNYFISCYDSFFILGFFATPSLSLSFNFFTVNLNFSYVIFDSDIKTRYFISLIAVQCLVLIDYEAKFLFEKSLSV